MYVVLVKVDDEITGVIGLFDTEKDAFQWAEEKANCSSQASFSIVEITEPY